MSALRTIASALCIVIGALLIASWAASSAALDAIENGTAIEDATSKALTSAEARTELVDHGTEFVLAALDDAGFNTNIPGIEAITAGIVDSVVTSDTFATIVHSQTRSVREQTVEQLTGDGEGAISVTLDVSDEVNAKLGEIPVIGGILPTITVPGVPVEVMDAQTADTVRNLWDWLHRAQTWFGWIGLLFLAVGILVSFRKRWFFAKVLFTVAAVSGIVWFAMTRTDPQTIANAMGGGNVVDAIITEIVRGAQSTVATAMGWVALGAMIGALVLSFFAARGNKGVES